MTITVVIELVDEICHKFFFLFASMKQNRKYKTWKHCDLVGNLDQGEWLT